MTGPSPHPPAALTGRETELRRIATVLADAQRGLRALALTGPAGMGKTTILRAALDATVPAARVMAARPSESETQLDLAALADLFADVDDVPLAALPEPQARALATALRRAAIDAAADPLAVSQAVLGVIRSLAAERPLVIAVDDAQWLDAPTARILEFVIRRLDRDVVTLVATIRTASPDERLPALLRAVPDERLTRLEVGPLDAGSLVRLLAERLGTTPTAGTARRIRELSGGNPFYALELARAGVTESSDASLVAGSLSELVTARLGALSPAAADVALVAAAAIQPTRSLILDVIGDAAGAAAGLDETAAAGVLESRPDGSITFAHPLLAWAAYGAVSGARRLEVHERLASVAPDPDERVRHLAIVTMDPTEAVAAGLEDAADRASCRGAPETAADLMRDSLRLTPGADADAVARRTLGAAEHAIQAGDPRRARSLLERYVDDRPTGPARAAALVALADLRSGDDWEVRRTLLERAAAEADPDSVTRLTADVQLGVSDWMLVRDLPAALVRSRAALERAVRSGAPTAIVRASTATSFLAMYVGEVEAAFGHLAPGLEHEAAVPGLRTLFRPTCYQAILLDWADRLDEALVAWREVAEGVERAGDADSRPLVLMSLALVELRIGSSADAYAHLDEGELAAELLGHATSRGTAAGYRARMEAQRGELVRARASAELGIAIGEATNALTTSDYARVGLALVQLAEGDPIAAAATLDPAVARLTSAGVDHSPAITVIPTAAEAYALAGRLDDAAALVTRLLAIGEREGHPSSLRAAHHVRALVLAARGDIDAAIEAAERSLDAAARLPEPHEEARVRLVHGELLRRARRRAPAREAIRAALETFERLGARVWVDRARTELARAGLPTPGSGGDIALTPTQREVALLVAAGRTNREVAATLFMSPHTVEAHLTTIYRTLGIRTRTDLARMLAGGAAGPVPPGVSEGQD